MSAESWIHDAQRGDARAFNHLVDTFQGVAYHVALHHLHGDSDAALDACQEAFVKAWQAVGRFEGDARGFRAWLVQIVVNACRDRRRYDLRRPQQPLTVERDGDTRAVPLPDGGESPEAYAARAELGDLLGRALQVLSAEHREVVLLDHAGFSYAEIAEIVGVETGTVKSRLSRARVRLRDWLVEQGGIEHRPSGRGEVEPLPTVQSGTPTELGNWEPASGAPRSGEHGAAPLAAPGEPQASEVPQER